MGVAGADSWQDWLAVGQSAAQDLAGLFNNFRWGAAADAAFKKAAWVAPAATLAEIGGKWVVLEQQAAKKARSGAAAAEKAHEYSDQFVDLLTEAHALLDGCEEVSQQAAQDEPETREPADPLFEETAQTNLDEAERLGKQAEELANSWKEVGDRFAEARGRSIRSQLAFGRALDIVQSRQSSAAGGDGLPEAEQGADELTREELEAFRAAMVEGLSQQAAALGLMREAAPALERIENTKAEMPRQGTSFQLPERSED